MMTNNQSNEPENREQIAYMVNSIKSDITVSVMGQNKTLPCSDLADGCIGVSLWFDTMENASAYGEDGDYISPGTYEQRQIINPQKEVESYGKEN
jgi:hypothetical protein